jgi:hypothetical protein
MPSQVLLHFLAGTAGALALVLLFARLAGERSFSLPAGCLVIGIVCATLAHFLSPWATPVVLVLYAIANLHELRQGR